MGIISIEKVDHLYWLGRYTERVYTTIRIFFHIYDKMIEQPEGIYAKYCERLNIPNIYTSNKQFVRSYLFGEENPDSVVSNMKRAYDNAVVLRDELSSNVLSYVQLALNTLESCGKTTAPLLELQQAVDYLLAFWGCADDYVEQEDCRNILKCGKYVERLDLCIRLDYHRKDLEKEYQKLINRLKKTSLCYNEENLNRLREIIFQEDGEKIHDQEALCCLGGLLS
ncbi:MAG TPA: alpha-E domain-containing protein [Candidatus Limivivens merdigallinarum]|uniref:Alpha-E domain-containing protein n=1 Tax=Candidatus Limivivens merdigallinarum TaxID=2840859 RepID=A0A9D0ZVL9_9FIRM|nr:alpha-E domain-containing protein [Candidatus Limivivens merdigallinarum]